MISFNDMNQKLLETIEKETKIVNQKNEYLNILKNLDLKEILTEEKWHQLCKTSLRNSILLEIFVQNIFPEAKNITLRANYVEFELYGFNCAIPTTIGDVIFVDLSFYNVNLKEPNFTYSYDTKKMINYFIALDNSENWKTLVKLRLYRSQDYTNLGLFYHWFFDLKWKDPHKEKWEERKTKELLEFEKNKELYKQKIKERHEKSIIFVKKLIPELLKFTKKITYNTDSSFNKMSDYNLEKIKKLENI